MQIILRRVDTEAVTPEALLEVLRKSGRVTLLHCAGVNILVECEDELPSAITTQLSGWIVSPQLERAQIPNTRILVIPATRRAAVCNEEPSTPVYL